MRIPSLLSTGGPALLLGEMVMQGLPSQQSTVEGIGDASRCSPVYVPDYTVEAATDLVIVRISVEQYAGQSLTIE